MLSSRLPRGFQSVNFARGFLTEVMQYYCYIIIIRVIACYYKMTFNMSVTGALPTP
jgi:hypothetical protein